MLPDSLSCWTIWVGLVAVPMRPFCAMRAPAVGIPESAITIVAPETPVMARPASPRAASWFASGTRDLAERTAAASLGVLCRIEVSTVVGLDSSTSSFGDADAFGSPSAGTTDTSTLLDRRSLRAEASDGSVRADDAPDWVNNGGVPSLCPAMITSFSGSFGGVHAEAPRETIPTITVPARTCTKRETGGVRRPVRAFFFGLPDNPELSSAFTVSSWGGVRTMPENLRHL
ncbi:hypothetical protein D9M72_516670 [compost metagenome]